MGHSSERVRPIPPALDRYRVRLGNVEEIDSENVTVTIGISYVSEPDLLEFPNNTDTREYEYELQRSPDGFWLIAESEWPHVPQNPSVNTAAVMNLPSFAPSTAQAATS